MSDQETTSFAGEDHLTQAMAYAEGFLSDEEKAAFEAHLATCAQCRRAVATSREVFPKLDAALAARARAGTRERRLARPRWAARLALAAVAAAVLAALAFGAWPALEKRLAGVPDPDVHSVPRHRR